MKSIFITKTTDTHNLTTGFNKQVESRYYYESINVPCVPLFSGSNSQLTVTQPAVITSSLGSTVTLTCTTNPKVKTWSDGTSRVHWYLQKSGETPKLVMRNGKNPTDEFSSRFTGRGDGVNTALTISGVQTEDATVYYCEFSVDSFLLTVQEVFVRPLNDFVLLWYTFGGGTKLIIHCKPSVSLLPPSSEQLSGGSATLACLLTGYSPQGAVVSWEVDGTAVTEGVLDSSEEEKSGRYSSSSTLSLSREHQWRKAGSVSCEAGLNGQSPVTQILNPDHCSE
uniref:Ig-like domain-containing protein n=1 Tax=Lates calcarifer TaxID=8187 RepID=A0A4W6E0L1_LATCA